jgi:hypothetical protein
VSCCQCRGIETLFGERTARRDLKHYREKGPLRTTRILLNAIRAEGVRGSTLLDIGGGVGAISNELLNAGAMRATAVDASPAYLQAAQEEAERQGHADRIEYHHGDFVDVVPRMTAADIVTLDRVICCYDDMQALVSASVNKARRLYGLVYPRDTWWDRLGVAIVNLACRVRRNPFRVFVHSPEAVERILRSEGFARRFYCTTPIWQIVVYAR